MSVIRDDALNILIRDLELYKKDGVIDPWILELPCGGYEIIEPLDALLELRELRDRYVRNIQLNT